MVPLPLAADAPALQVAATGCNATRCGLHDPCLTCIVPRMPAGEGCYLALRLSFQLPTSCYATMLIRELTKMDTATAFQKTLTLQH